jgi:hypothetical protein
MQQKECLVCKKIYFNKNYCRATQWDKSKFCSIECRRYAQTVLKIGVKPKKEMPSKTCEICNNLFERKSGSSTKIWERRVVCSMKCLILWDRKHNIGYKKGHPGYKNSGSFKTGIVPWNTNTHFQSNNSLEKYRKENNNVSAFKGRKQTEEAKQKIRIARAKQVFPTGPEHWNYKHGQSPFRTRLYNTYLYKKWRSTIFERDNYTCQFCGQRGGRLNVDHIKPFSLIVKENKITTIEEAKKCLELWNLSNGRTLCFPCHFKTETYGNKVQKILN